MAVCARVSNRCTHLQPVPPFYLFTTPPKLRLPADSANLLQARLAPAALLHLAFEGESLDRLGEVHLRAQKGAPKACNQMKHVKHENGRYQGTLPSIKL
eukprot:1223966-Pyramimonas_sp.AAC.1